MRVEKKKCWKKICLAMAALTAVMIIGSGKNQENQVFASDEAAKVDMIFVTDVHSHYEDFVTKVDGKDTPIGGIARMKTLIDEKIAECEDVLFLDGGDFSMGTLLQTLYQTEASELRLLGAAGFEVTTLGNHEFDYLSDGLADMMYSALASNEQIPEIVICNVDWETMEQQGLDEEQQLLKNAFDTYGVKDYTMIEKNGVNIAVTGVFGKDSLTSTPTCALLFKDPIEAVKETVEEIKQTENADMIVCVSHSGINLTSEKKSEDELLAKAVPDLDLILSGHTHILLEEPIQHGDTYIVSPKAYGEYMGFVSMERKANGRWQLRDYEVTLVDQTIEEDEDLKKKVETFSEMVNERYLSQFGYESSKQVLVENEVEFCAVDDIYTYNKEHALGSIIADAYVYAARQSGNVGENDICVAIAPSGTIRESFMKGPVTVGDTFNAFSLGIGSDGLVGYPLLSFYVNGKDLKLAAEVDASISDLMKAARLYMSGMHYSFTPNRILLNKVTDVYLVGEDGSRVEIEDDTLYHVTTDLYSAQMLGAVTNLSYGLLEMYIRDADGNLVEDLNDIIMYHDGKEVKAWHAIAQYMESFEDTDANGIPNVPMSYQEDQGRKIVNENANLLELFQGLNTYSIVIIAVVVVVILLLLVLLFLLVKTGRAICRRIKMK